MVSGLKEALLSRFVRIAGPEGSLGTGFRLSGNRVLTAHHVIRDKAE